MFSSNGDSGGLGGWVGRRRSGRLECGSRTFFCFCADERVINGGRISREKEEVVVVMEVGRRGWKEEMRGEFKLTSDVGCC